MYDKNQNTTDDNKDLWIKEYARKIITSAVSEFSEERKIDFICWDIYHGKSTIKKFNYLTQVEGLTYPAKFRNIGNELVRGKLNLLESKQSRRTFRFKAIAMDERSLKEKHINQVKAYLNAIKTIHEERDALLQTQINSVQEKLNDLHHLMQ